MDALLTPSELAHVLKVSRGHVYRLVQQRKIPFIKSGGSIRFMPSSIERWIKEQEICTVRDVLRGQR